MKKRTWVVLLVLAFLLLVVVVAVPLLFLVMRQAPRVQEGSVLEVVLEETIRELPTDNPLLQLLQGEEPSLWELTEAVRRAGGDNRIAALYLQVPPLSWSWAQIEELRQALHDFRRSGKKVHALAALDGLQESEAYLLSAADSVTLNPDAGILINGFLAEVVFYKRTLDLLGIKPDFIQFKEYKSAETYTRQNLSQPVREMLESVLGDLQERFVSTVARERGIPAERVRQLMERGIGGAGAALEAGLVDRLGYADEVLSELGVTGENASKRISVKRYLKALRPQAGAKRVALVGGMGMIVAGEREPLTEMIGGVTLAQQLREVREEEDFQGVILRVDSPGGSAVGSDMVWREVRLLEEAGKPVVVSMAGVAGSGGYYISMGAGRIVAQPSTITGSIGVIMGKFDVSGLYKWLGMDIDRVELSPNADLFSPFSSLSAEQKEQITRWMEEIYHTFVRKAAEARGLSFQELEAQARGRIYTGAQAEEIGLVDRLGGLETAVALMKEALQVPEEENLEVVLYPRPKTLWESLTSGEWLQADPRLALRSWLEREVRHLSALSPWLLMPEIRIY